MRGLLRFLGVQLRPGNYRSRPSFFSSFFPFPRSRGIGPYSIRFISFHLIIFPLQLFVLLRYVNCLSAEGTDGGGKTWADTRCNWAEHLKSERRQWLSWFSNVWSHLVWSLLQHGHHPVSFTVATYVLYHYYLYLLPNIHILEIHERVCLKIEVWNPVLFYVYSLSHHEYNHTYEPSSNNCNPRIGNE
jgi:hypothetical protein